MTPPSVRRALVTAGRTGIGAAIVRALEAAGVEVWATTRTPDGPRQLQVDAADASALERAVSEVRPAIVVHAAASFPAFASAERADADEARAAWQVKVDLGARLVAAALPHLRADGAGRIVLIGSAAGAVGAAGQSAYAAANAALVGLARSYAVEAGRDGVTANVVAPGLVPTPRLERSVSAEVRDRLVRGTATGRPVDADEVAALVEFLCRPGTRSITGAVLSVDGGLGLGVLAPADPTP